MKSNKVGFQSWAIIMPTIQFIWNENERKNIYIEVEKATNIASKRKLLRKFNVSMEML